MNMLKERGFRARRGVQFNGLLDHDVRTDLPFNFECKAVERLDLYAAFQQSRDDCAKGEHPLVVHKRNRGQVLLTMQFDVFLDLLQWATKKLDNVNCLHLEKFWMSDEVSEYREGMEKEMSFKALTF